MALRNAGRHFEHNAITPGTDAWTFTSGDKTVTVHLQGRFKADSAHVLVRLPSRNRYRCYGDIVADPYVAKGALVPIMTDYKLPPVGIYIVRPLGKIRPRKSPGTHRPAGAGNFDSKLRKRSAVSQHVGCPARPHSYVNAIISCPIRTFSSHDERRWWVAGNKPPVTPHRGEPQCCTLCALLLASASIFVSISAAQRLPKHCNHSAGARRPTIVP